MERFDIQMIIVKYMIIKDIGILIHLKKDINLTFFAWIWKFL